jgi:phospholipase C
MRSVRFVAIIALVLVVAIPTPAGAASRRPGMSPYRNLVVIFQENHSFDNLYGNWGRVGRQRVDGVDQADAAHTVQVDLAGQPYACLKQNDVNLTSPPLGTTCTDAARGFTSAFENAPFTIDDYIMPEDTTCPPGAYKQFGTPKGQGKAGGCTEDLVHRFYQEKYQINGGRQNRYVTGSDAIGLTMGTYDTTQLGIYKYLHGAGAPHYVIADHFFQGANGGSFLNHQWLIAGRAPVVDPLPTLPTDRRPRYSVLDSNGMPTTYDLYQPPGVATRVDGNLTVACPDGDLADYANACGNFAVNTVQPGSAPRSGSGAAIPLIDDQKYPNIGDRLTAKGISWAWYSGGWDAADAGSPGPLFQYHHQPFNYFADYAPGKPGRLHLQDVDDDFLKAAAVGNLPRVSFVKPYGAENEHPGYASAADGSDYLVTLIKAVLDGPQAEDTLVIVTYDEFGGQWDHVPPPGAGSPTKGAYDAFGPGTRIPALLVSAAMSRSGVDHTVYDTTSILTTLEHQFRLAPVGIRDARVPDLSPAIRLGQRRH